MNLVVLGIGVICIVLLFKLWKSEQQALLLMKKHNDLQTNLETMSEERDQYKTLYESSLEERAQSEPVSLR